MPKRFTEDDKWDHRWFRKLSPNHKLAWLYMLDVCSKAAVYSRDDELANFKIGTEVDWDGFIEASEGRVILLSDDKWWIPNHLKRQHPKGLNESCKPHGSVILALESLNLLVRVSELLGEGFITFQEKDKDKEKDKVKEKEKGKNSVSAVARFSDWWSTYPKKVGKQAAEKAYAKAVAKVRLGGKDSPEQFLIERCKAFANSDKGQGNFIPNPATWLNEGRYDDDPKAWQENGKGRTEAGQHYDPTAPPEEPRIGL